MMHSEFIIILCVQTVLTVTSDWWLDQVNWKVALRSVLMECGALCAVTCGELRRAVWPAGSLDSHRQVKPIILIHAIDLFKG